MVRKGQSAMEYLMTYGWAILIIVVVLAALFYMGVFTPSPGESCKFAPGSALACKSFKIYNQTTGISAFLIVDNLGGQKIIIDGMYCTQAAALPTAGAPTTLVPTVTIEAGGEAQVPTTGFGGIICRDTANNPVTTGFAIGSPYRGKVYVRFTDEAGLQKMVIANIVGRVGVG